MRTIERTTQFKKDFKKASGNPKHWNLDALLVAIVKLLVADTPLPSECRDHALTGQWKDHRDCHIKPDLVLIYRKPDKATLQLVRLGSHSDLFG